MKPQNTAERWVKVKEVLNVALDLDTKERAAYVAEVCAGDAQVKAEVESMLSVKTEAEAVFENTERRFFSEKTFESVEDVFSGRIIGNYRLLHEIGAGGMGVVFLAEHTGGEFEQQVAVKILRRGLESKQAIRRFALERQILAKFHHPNIAQMLDGGTTSDGLPYLVMEYVEGLPVTKYAAENDLTVSQRLDLFRQVCSGVSYAHRNLIVHRDLKPDNILVTSEGIPKLLDFGIAKLLSADSIKATVTRWQALTPDYAAPEQITGGQITTVSDVYSLGVILYELLTGIRPFYFQTNNPDEILRNLNQIAPTRPSSVIGNRRSVVSSKSLNTKNLSSPNKETATSPKSRIQNPKSLKGDLDNIILKALRKEPERRYSSVEQLSEDLRRHLAGLTISARRDTFAYRAEKFFKRNRFSVAAAALIFTSLVGGLGAAIWQSRVADAERLRAETERAAALRNAENIRKISNTLIVEVHDAVRNLPGSLPVRELLLKRAVEQLNLLDRDAGDDPKLQAELGTEYFSVGEMQQALGHIDETEKAHRRAVEIYENLALTDPENAEYRRQLGKGYDFLGNVFYMRGEMADYAEYNRKAFENLKIAAEKDNSVSMLKDLWEVSANYQISLNFLGKNDEALKTAYSIVPLAEKLAAQPGDDPAKKRYSYLAQLMITASLYYSGDYEAAAVSGQNALQNCIVLQAANPLDTRFSYDLWTAQRWLGMIYAERGEAEKALYHLNKALPIIENLLHNSPQDAGYKRNTAVTYREIGKALNRFAKSALAIPVLEKSRKLSEELFAVNADNGETRTDLAIIYAALGEAKAKIDKYTEAVELEKKSTAYFEQLLIKNAQNALLKRQYALALFRASFVYTGLAAKNSGKSSAQNIAQARIMLEKSAAIWREMKAQGVMINLADVNLPIVLQQLQNLDSGSQ